MRAIYTLLIWLLRPFALGLIVWRGFRDRRQWLGLGERLGYAAIVPDGPVIWVHAVSLGEVTAAAPLIEGLAGRHPRASIVLTTATFTGRERALSLFGATVRVSYLPYDAPGAMRRWLTRAHPRLAVIMETELWPNLYRQCRARGIPVVLANARLSERSTRRYRRFGTLFRDVFAGDVRVAAQSAQDAARFIAVGAAPSRTTVVGNVKFDREVPAELAARGAALRDSTWPGRPLWIAGSTHAGEEEAVLTAHLMLLAALPSTLLLLVPRHPPRFAAVAELLTRRGVPFERRSAGAAVTPGCPVLLVDTVGELASLYAAADVAFVGGSLVPIGGHNLLEPAALGVPVLAGPHQSNGAEVAELLETSGAMLRVADAGALGAALCALFADPGRRSRMGEAGRAVVAANRGSVRRLLDLIEPLARASPEEGN